jgi:hypothetical protein
MERLADHLNDPDAEHHPDWPIMLKANLPIGETQDDPDWWSSATGGVDSEDITNWTNYAYILVGLTAPRAGTVRLAIDYRVPAISDPCYTDFGWRFGADGEWEYSTTARRLTYDVAVEAGAGSYLVPFILNRERVLPTKAWRRHIIESIRFELPETADPEVDETWELTGLALVEDPGEGEREEPESHVSLRCKMPWDWIGANWMAFGGVVDGLDALELDYGYGHWRQEQKLLHIQRREHSPDYGGPATRLDYAKSLGRWCSELNWQEGFNCTWPDPPPEEQAENQDADEDRLAGTLYWWDLEQSNEEFPADPRLALLCGTYTVVAGLEYEFLIDKHPQGRIHGVAVDTGHTQILREREDLVPIYEDGALLEKCATDEHGRYMSSPLRELGGPYRAGNVVGLQIANREYTTALIRKRIGTRRGNRVAMFAHPMGLVPWTVWLDDANVLWIVETRGPSPTTVGTPMVIDSSGDYETCYATTDGNVIYVDAWNGTDGTLDRFLSYTCGESWEGPTVVG